MDGTFWDKQTENRGGLPGGVIDEKQTKKVQVSRDFAIKILEKLWTTTSVRIFPT